MHHALLMPDIQAHLFAAIKEDDQTWQCTLVTLAKTCSGLSEAALDALWSNMDGLRPLARCIYAANTPPLSDECTPEADNNMGQNLTIFYKYARRVRILDLSGQRVVSSRHSGHRSVSDDLFALIHFAMPFPILPNLRRLVWAPGISLNLLRHFLNPHLQSLKIPNHRWRPESTLFSLSKIPHLCPKIRSLTLQILSLDRYPEPELSQSYILQIISLWRELEELDYNPTTRESVLRLSGLTSLRILRLRMNRRSVVDLPSDSLLFPSLHTLQLKVDTLETAITFMGATKCSPKSVTINVCVGGPQKKSCSSEFVGILFHLVIRDESRHRLRDLSLNFPYILGADPVHVSDMLRPLFVCDELRTLRIYMTLRFVLGDDDLRMMAAAWPRLEGLELIDSRPRVLFPPPEIPPTDFGHSDQLPHPPPPVPPAGADQTTQPEPPQPPIVAVPGSPANTDPLLSPAVIPAFYFPDQLFHVRLEPPEITFHGLISLLELCPRLRYFDLAIDATKLDGLRGDKPGGGVCNRLVKCARFVDSPVGDPVAVAHILRDILPELDSIELDSLAADVPLLDPPHAIHLGWFAVRQIILASKRATAQS